MTPFQFLHSYVVNTYNSEALIMLVSQDPSPYCRAGCNLQEERQGWGICFAEQYCQYLFKKKSPYHIGDRVKKGRAEDEY